jgi:hypothetical protein
VRAGGTRYRKDSQDQILVRFGERDDCLSRSRVGWGLALRVWSVGCGAAGLVLQGSDSRFRAEGLGFGVQGSGFRV